MKNRNPERRSFGATTIEVQDDEFFNGYQVGNFYFHAHKQQAELLTDAAIYGFLCEVLQGVRETDRYRTGAISGWYAAVYDYKLTTSLLAQNPHTASFCHEGNAQPERG